MFTGTLRMNLDPEELVSDERITELLKEAMLDGLLTKDPKGLYQDIAENGSNLSSGEKQLICICRAILRVILLIIVIMYRKAKLLYLMRQQPILM